MNDVFLSKPYKKGRFAYQIQCAVEYMVTLLISDVFLAKVLKSIGLTDGDIGVISSLISFAFMMQLFSIPILQHIKSVKKYVLITDSLSLIFCMLTFTLPFFPFSSAIKRILAFVFVACGMSFRYISFNIYYKWANSYVDPLKRGRFTSVKESLSLVIGIIMSLAMGYLFDHFESINKLDLAFRFVAVYIAVLVIINFLLILQIPENNDPEEKHAGLKSIFSIILRNKFFLKLIILQCLVRFATSITIGFLGTYKTQELGFSISFTQIIGTVALLGQLIVAIPFGIFSDKNSYAKGYLLGCFLSVCAFVCLVLTTPQTKWLIIVFTIFNGCAASGTGSNATNMLYSYIPIEYLSQSQAIMSSICGLCGFIASLIGRIIINAVQKNGNSLGGIPIYGQQVMAFISALLFVAAIVYGKKYISNQKDMKQ